MLQLKPKATGLTRVLVCPDAHHPYVDKQAWRTFLAAAQAWKPHVTVVVGDFIDCYSISDYPKSPKRTLLLKRELDAAGQALKDFELCTPGAARVYLEGNHEERLPRSIYRLIPGLDDLVGIPEYLKLKERGWRWVPYGKWMRIGKFAFAHDLGHAGVNAARQTLLAFGNNIVFGHTHRGGVVYDGTVRGERHVCLNVGWLGDMNAIDYGSKAQQIRSWQHGFGAITMAPDGAGWAQFVPIIKGRCVLDGRIVRG